MLALQVTNTVVSSGNKASPEISQWPVRLHSQTAVNARDETENEADSLL